MDDLNADRLIEACGDDGVDAGITIRAHLEPLSGPGGLVKPAVYEGGKYQLDERWWGIGSDRSRVRMVVIDNVPSQANRIEAALAKNRQRLALPGIELDLSGIATLPSHLPRTISAFQFPHRNADAYLRDAAMGGVKFPSTKQGAAIFAASADNPSALFEWMPQALLFGFWQSHLGKKRQQTKLARSWVSEIVGVDPATVETTLMGLKGDPLNLSIDDAVEYDEDDVLGWSMSDTTKKGKGAGRERLSEIGHGQVPVGGAPAGLSFRAIEQQSTVSFAGLRRISCETDAASAAGRALLVAIGLAGHVLAFQRPFSLRSGADLRPVETRWVWLGANGDSDLRPLTPDEAVALVVECARRAEAAGLPVGSKWVSEPLTLTPNDNLRKAIEKSYPLDQGT